MTLWDSLSSLFCSKYQNKVRDLEAENTVLREDKRVLKRNYSNLLEEKQELVAALTAETLDLYQQLQDLQAVIASSMPIPDISIHLDNPILFKPFNEDIGIPLGLIGDAEYYTWTLEQWRQMLSPVQDVVREHALKNGWVTEISDCENFAVVMSGILMTSFLHSGLDKQGAFLLTRSRSHAYNVFVARDGDVFTPYVYEPQSDKVVGKLDMVDWEPYVTIKGWYLGTAIV